jgi:Flp pilus assembly protein TadD
MHSIEIEPDDPALLVRAARLMFDIGARESTDSISAQAEKLAPPQCLFWPELDNVRGISLALYGDREEAVRRLRAAHDAEPHSARFARDLAILLNALGRAGEAVGVLDRTICVRWTASGRV